MFRLLCLFCILLSASSPAVPEAVVRQTALLLEVLKEADEAYFEKHESFMSDAAYDAMRVQYRQLIRQYPELSGYDRVGYSVSTGKVEHSKPVLSLMKAYSDEEVEAFIQQCGMHLMYCIEPKIDGLTVVLTYRDGLLTQALTRGNGKVGSDVTKALLASGCVPMKLSESPAVLEVRGEVYLPTDQFNRLNEQRAADGKPLLKSPRNSASGTLRLTDYTAIAKRGLSMQIFELIQTDEMPVTHSDALLLVKNLGLPVVECRKAEAGQVLSTIASMYADLGGRSFLTDGLVIKVDDLSRFNELGSTSHHPRGAVARKYKTLPAETTLRAIEWLESDAGRKTPIALFDPVEIGGATVERASLYNANHLKALGLNVGDRIHVIRAGGAVPEVVGRVVTGDS